MIINMIYQVYGKFLEPRWNGVWERISRVLRKMGIEQRYTEEFFKEAFKSNQYQLWYLGDSIFPEAIVVTVINTFPSGVKVYTIFLIEGKGLDTHMKEVWEFFEIVARINDCSELTFGGREGWKRALNKITKVDTVSAEYCKIL